MNDAASVKRVLMTADTAGGVWTFALDLAEALGAYGIEVLLAAMGLELARAQQAGAERLANLRLEFRKSRLEWMENPWEDIEASSQWLKTLADRFQPDVIHWNTYGHAAEEWDLPAVLTAHSCVLSWWQAVHGTPAPAGWSRYQTLVAAAVRSAAVVTAPSRSMLQTFEANYGPVPNSRVVANGRKKSPFRPMAKEPIILSAGRLWDEGKNIGLLAGVAGELEWPVFLAGQPRHPDGGLAVAAGCHALGQLDLPALSEWYGRAAIYALPARYEPFGLSALEAALSECALVLSDIPSLRETWEDAAVFVPAEDAGAWTAELRSLIRDAAARRELGARARGRAREFTPERMACEYRSCYIQAIRQLEAACAS